MGVLCIAEEPAAKYGRRFQNGTDIKKAPWENPEGALTSETATMQRTDNGFGNKATVISEGALTNPETATMQRTDNGFGKKATVISGDEGTKVTKVTINLDIAKSVTLRVSNHNAVVGNFDKNDETEGISVVVSNYANTGLKNDGKAHVTEFFYRRADINRSKEKPLVEILDSLQKMLQTGEYVDTTGLAYVEEVNRG